MPTLAEIHTLHRYYIWADRFRAAFDRLLSTENVDAMEPLLWFAGEGGKFDWYSALHVVVEGWNELGLKDPEIDPLLTSPNVGHLKR